MKKREGLLGRFLGFLISLFLLIGMSVIIVSFYPRIVSEANQAYEEANKELKQDQEVSIRQYMTSIYPLTYGVYVDYLYEKGGVGTAGDLLFDPLLTQYNTEEENYLYFLNCAENFSYWYQQRYRNLMDMMQIEYLISDQKTGTTYGELDDTALESSDTYPFLIQISIANGQLKVLSERGAVDTESLYSYFFNQGLGVYGEDSRYLILNQNLSEDVTITFASRSNQYLTYYVERISRYDYMDAMMPDYVIVIGTAMLFTVLLGLLLPFAKPFNLHKGWKANIPLELVIAAVITVFYMQIEELPWLVFNIESMIQAPDSSFTWTGMLFEFMTRERENTMLLILNAGIWFVLLAVTYLCSLSIRQLFAKGLVRYFKEDTVLGIILVFLIRLCRRFFSSIKKINLEEKGQKFIFLIVLGNFIAVSLLCCIWFAGLFGAVIYSVIIFFVLCNYWKKIKKQYQALLLTTREMANGSTSVEYSEEVGMFEGLRDELIKVQSGFNKSVQEEVRSQRMKTELITNVSHDLKTPLTAIITYIDLLKKEDLSEEERQSYIQVLEQKSTRLKRLIEDLFEISKANSQTIVIHPVQMDLTALLREIRVELEDRIMKSGIDFRFLTPDHKIMVALDSQKTYRIFENLMNNIIKYGLCGSRAYIIVEEQPDDIIVTLKNVSQCELSFDTTEITERFVRGDASRNTEGSGLGLAIAKSFAEAQGGALRIEVDGDLFKAIVTLPKNEIESEGSNEEATVLLEEEGDAITTTLVTDEESK